MNVSAILAVALPEKLDAMVSTLNRLPGVEVHHVEKSTGRMILSQEAQSIDDEVKGLQEIKKIPGIVMADMVQHYFGDDEKNHPTDAPDELNDHSGTACVPAYLNE